MKVVLATNNSNKLRELTEMSLGAPWLELILAPASFNPEETGATFLDNATIKAKECARLTGMVSVADDSGIAVEALDGMPGIHSARYCEGTDGDRRQKLLKAMAGVPDNKRNAAFVCAMAVCNPEGELLHGTLCRWEGVLAWNERGENGFGYDPIFFLPDRGKTSAELEPDEKNEVSHRAQAWKKTLAFLKELDQK